MVAAKVKVPVDVERGTKDGQPQSHKIGSVRSFKVYSENERVKAEAGSLGAARESTMPTRRISVPTNGKALLDSASDAKGSSKIVEKIKSKHDNSLPSVKQNVRRKALADLSNVQSSFSNLGRDGSKLTISAGQGPRTSKFSSGKPSMGKRRDNLSQKVSDLCGTIKDDHKSSIRNPVRASTVNDIRRNTKISVAPIRKSLPVLRRKSQEDASNIKKDDESSDTAQRISGFRVKVKVSNKTVPEVGTSQNHLQKNRMSDRVVMMATQAPTKVDTHVSSRKFVRRVEKTSGNASNVQRTSKSKILPNMRNSKSLVVTSLHKKDEDHNNKSKPVVSFHEAVTSSLSENISIGVSCEATREPSSDSNSGLIEKKSDSAKRTSHRRRSYTSALMARSKLLESHDKAVEHETLPSIDDTCNQLEVAEYVDDIYQYYWVSEAQNSSLANYMSTQTDISPQMRGIVINWLLEVHFKFELMPETLFLMVTLLDRYLSQVQIKKKELQLVGLTALLLASKYEDFWHPRIRDLISISAESYTRDQMLLTEKLFLKKLKFRLNEPTPYVFMLRFLKAAQSDLKLEHLAFYLIELCLVEYEALQFKPSIICASAIYVARCTLQMHPAWSPLLAKHTHYRVEQIRDCCEMLLRFQKAARTAQLRVTYEKYTGCDLSGVADIEPLTRLPF